MKAVISWFKCPFYLIFDLNFLMPTHFMEWRGGYFPRGPLAARTLKTTSFTRRSVRKRFIGNWLGNKDVTFHIQRYTGVNTELDFGGVT